MPAIAGGMDAHQLWTKYRTPLMIGGGGLALFLLLRRGGSGVGAVAVSPPVSDGGAVAVPTPPAAQPDAAQGAANVSDLQEQMQREALREQVAGFNLSLLSQQQQQRYEGQTADLQLRLGQEQLHQQQEVTYGLYRANRPKGAGGVVGWLQRVTGVTPQVAQQYTQAASQAAALYAKIGG